MKSGFPVILLIEDLHETKDFPGREEFMKWLVDLRKAGNQISVIYSISEFSVVDQLQDLSGHSGLIEVQQFLTISEENLKIQLMSLKKNENEKGKFEFNIKKINEIQEKISILTIFRNAFLITPKNDNEKKSFLQKIQKIIFGDKKREENHFNYDVKKEEFQFAVPENPIFTEDEANVIVKKIGCHMAMIEKILLTPDHLQKVDEIIAKYASDISTILNNLKPMEKLVTFCIFHYLETNENLYEDNLNWILDKSVIRFLVEKKPFGLQRKKFIVS